MFKVECPGCQAPYQVDERRVPASGLAMRCPKCGTSFRVNAPDAEPLVAADVDLPARPQEVAAKFADLPRPVSGPGGGALPSGQGGSRTPMPMPTASSRTNPGVAVGRSGARGGSMGTMIGVAPPRASTELASAGTKPEPPRDQPLQGTRVGVGAQAAFGTSDLDLPALSDSDAALPAMAPGRTLRTADDLPSVVHGSVGLPATSVAKTPSLAPGLPSEPPLDLTDELDFSWSKSDPAPAAAQSAVPVTAPAKRGAVPPLPPASAARLPPPRHAGTSALATPEGLSSKHGQEFAREVDERLPSVSRGNLPSLASSVALPSLAADLPLVSAELPSPAANLPSPAQNLPTLAAAGLPERHFGDLDFAAASEEDPFAEAAAPVGRSDELDLFAASDELDPFTRTAQQDSTNSSSIPASLGGGFDDDPFANAEGPAHGLLNAADLDFGAGPTGFNGDDEDPFAAPGSAPQAAVGGRALRGEFSEPPPEFAAPPARSIAPQPVPVRAESNEAARNLKAGGGAGYGEVDLGGGDELGGSIDADAPPSAGAEDEMEFGGIPQEDVESGDARSDAPGALRSRQAIDALPEVESEAQKRKRRKLRISAAAVFVFALAGGALTLVPDAGPFGWHFVGDQLKKGAHRQVLAKTAEEARTLFAQDSFRAAEAAVSQARGASANAPRFKPLMAYSAYVGYAVVLRFGSLPEVEARSKVVLNELAQADDVEALALARAAEAVVSGNLARARQLLDELDKVMPKDQDVALLRAELELKAKDYDRAAQAWNQLLQLGRNPHSVFGLARTLLSKGDEKALATLTAEVLALNPEHLDARTLAARLAWKQGDESAALAALEHVVTHAALASPRQLVDAQTLLGAIHFARGRVTPAEKAFSQALLVNPKASEALRGLGDTFYVSGRFSEALARFEAAAEADTDNVEARIGIGKAKISLERLDEAKAVLSKLNQEQPKNADVSFWVGQVEEALGNRELARDAYSRAIEVGGDRPDSVRAYVALALLQSQLGDLAAASATLAAAQKKLPESPEIHVALGDVSLSQGRYDVALAEFNRALELDNGNVEARFKVGSTLRRMRTFEQALSVLDDVAKVDPGFPGLALERGLLFEEWGRVDEALKEYETALARAPNDVDLMLRVGCARVGAGHGGSAEEILRKVLDTRTKPAESAHCLGRALLLKGDLAEALRLLKRAVDLAPKRPEYHLYLGWASNEAGRIPDAEQELQKALELDQGLADAYWQRGILRHRQSALQDAASDLSKAIELRPTRYEAHAELAGVYYDLGMEQKALVEWQIAVQNQPKNAAWRFRYGRLLAENMRKTEATQELLSAIELAQAATEKPRWLWQAHLDVARALGPVAAAVPHWKAFLQDAPSGSPYLDEARQALLRLGHPVAP